MTAFDTAEVRDRTLTATELQEAWPVLSAIKWDRQYHAMLATPLRNHLGRTIGVLQVLNKRAATAFIPFARSRALAASTIRCR